MFTYDGFKTKNKNRRDSVWSIPKKKKKKTVKVVQMTP